MKANFFSFFKKGDYFKDVEKILSISLITSAKYFYTNSQSHKDKIEQKNQSKFFFTFFCFDDKTFICQLKLHIFASCFNAQCTWALARKSNFFCSFSYFLSFFIKLLATSDIFFFTLSSTISLR